MNKALPLLLIGMAIAHADECNCHIYPFTPNPPCFQNCVVSLVRHPEISLKSIRGIDPGVAVSISALRTRSLSTYTDFSDIDSKEKLEGQALKVIPDTGGTIY